MEESSRASMNYLTLMKERAQMRYVVMILIICMKYELIEDIKSLAPAVTEASITHVRRQANSAAID